MGVQIKYHQDQTDVEALNQLVRGMDTEGISIGWLLSTAEYVEEMAGLAEMIMAEKNISLTLIDGNEFANMLLLYGLGDFLPDDLN